MERPYSTNVMVLRLLRPGPTYHEGGRPDFALGGSERGLLKYGKP